MRLWQRSIQWQLALAFGSVERTVDALEEGIGVAVMTAAETADAQAGGQFQALAGQQQGLPSPAPGGKCSARSHAWARVVPGSSTPNASPPRRSSESPSRRNTLRMRSAKALRQASPPAWPCSSLTFLEEVDIHQHQ